ncbi:proline-rich domain-containing protein, partial [Streptomyces sp. SID3343]|uniref:proline-rich domain-containing protein n=1 Tax=Streptomyces sp. SID3343 TaxID=2690260 RepID=UPI0013C1938F|nr:hypothetical protein [Streptomyces sp. SID3343]
MRPGATKRIVISGTLVALLIVAGFGNQWVYEKSVDGDADTLFKWYWSLLRIAGFPLWVIDKSGFEDTVGSGVQTRFVVAGFVAFAVLLVTVALLLAFGARGLGERAAAFNALLLGWFSLVVGGALFGLTMYAIAFSDKEYEGARGGSGFEQAMSLMQRGALFGIMCGWIVGVAALLSYVSAAPYTGPRAPYAGDPYGPMPDAYNQPMAYNPVYGAPPAGNPTGPPLPPQRPSYRPQTPHDAPTTIRPA